jgi:hypothetical protein
VLTIGKPSYDPDHPDYVPSMFSGGGQNKKEYAKVERYQRVKKRRIQRDKSPSTNEDTDQEFEVEDDITTLKSKVNQLMEGERTTCK